MEKANAVLLGQPSASDLKTDQGAVDPALNKRYYFEHAQAQKKGIEPKLGVSVPEYRLLEADEYDMTYVHIVEEA